MRKIFFSAGVIIASLLQISAQQQWDRQMKLTTCFINIKADEFIVTTFMEMEFCNPNDKEVEGLFRFQLNPGQVITAFQLDLNGKYRDGSIEEKWKVTNAYNTIVGKRIDPALLTMDYSGHYSLRIYPVPSNGCRKVTMTIQQLLPANENRLQYSLPLDIDDTVQHFKLKISAQSNVSPIATAGLLEGRNFLGTDEGYTCNWETNKILLKKPLQFFISLSNQTTFCTKAVQQQTNFALRFTPSGSREIEIHPKRLTVFWDASASESKRELKKEINFLKQFISWHNIAQVRIIPFNYQLLDTAIFYTENGFNSHWQQYLQNITYDGATQLGCINSASIQSDIIFIFTDGNNTYGKRKPNSGNALLSCISTSRTSNLPVLQQILGSGGGKVIDLNKISINAAIRSCSRAENWLLNVVSASGKTIIEQPMPVKMKESMFFSGTMPAEPDTLYFQYGTNNHINYTMKIVVYPNDCTSSAIEKITMLHNFENIIRTSNWSDMIDIGLKEKIVTPHTAYIVLERLEDYVRYNITPPKDLQEECEKINYVKKDTRFERRIVEKASAYDILKNIVSVYNQRIHKWDAKQELINIDKEEYETLVAGSNKTGIQSNTENSVEVNTELTGKIAGISVNSNALKEVVVVGYGMKSKSAATGSVVEIRGQDIFSSATSIEQVLQGRVAGVQVFHEEINLGAASAIRIRGAGSMNTTQPLYVLDGIPVSGNINDLVQVGDIDCIIVLKGLAATSVYGGRAANGTILINTRRGKNPYNWYNDKPYRLKDLEDVEYLKELKQAGSAEKEIVYELLKEQYGGEAGFYLDAAQYFYELGLSKKAFEVLMNAAEASNGSKQVVVAMAYILENWKQYPEAINLYEQLVTDDPGSLYFHRDLAWVQYLSGNYQEAVDILFNAININTGQLENTNLYLKSHLLTDMNAMISAQRDKINTSTIPAFLIRSMPVDIRFVVDDNKENMVSAEIREPGGAISSYLHPVSKNGGMVFQDRLWYYNHSFEYQAKYALAGKYRIRVNFYDAYPYLDKIPDVLRIRTFKNFGRSNQSIETEVIMMDNQNGGIEIAEKIW